MRPWPFLLLLAGCPDPTNPEQVWIAPGSTGDTLSLKDVEPHPF